MPLGVRYHEILLGSHRIPTIVNRSDPQSNARTKRLERAVQKQHLEWDLVGSCGIQLGSHTCAHAGSSIRMPLGVGSHGIPLGSHRILLNRVLSGRPRTRRYSIGSGSPHPITPHHSQPPCLAAGTKYVDFAVDSFGMSVFGCGLLVCRCRSVGLSVCRLTT